MIGVPERALRTCASSSRIGEIDSRWTNMSEGGHFAALEEPEALAADIRAFFRPLRELA